MTPEERARAVVAYFPGIPAGIRPQVEDVVTRAIRRGLSQQLGELQIIAEREVRISEGRGKSAKGRDVAAIHFHELWVKRFRDMRKRSR